MDKPTRVTEFMRDCCLSYEDKNHIDGCFRMLALDESYKEDKKRHEDSLIKHSSEALRKRVLSASVENPPNTNPPNSDPPNVRWALP